jgi:hypothetical protein
MLSVWVYESERPSLRPGRSHLSSRSRRRLLVRVSLDDRDVLPSIITFLTIAICSSIWPGGAALYRHVIGNFFDRIPGKPEDDSVGAVLRHGVNHITRCVITECGSAARQDVVTTLGEDPWSRGFSGSTGPRPQQTRRGPGEKTPSRQGRLRTPRASAFFFDVLHNIATCVQGPTPSVPREQGRQ